MSIEWLTYPFLFIAIFFESFILVTFLSAPARAARGRAKSAATPTVSIIVPCLNEATTVGGTIESLLRLTYPADKLSIVVVDNASTDATPTVLKSYATHPQITCIREETRGKHHAVNAGIAQSEAELVGCLDADSFVDPAALQESISCFVRPNVAAVTAAMSVHEPKTILQYMQYADYLFAITTRHVMASINGLYVTPGPFSIYRRDVVLALGGFRFGHQTEDMEMALRLQRAGYEIENASKARVYTKTPRTLAKLIRQRTRWTSGFLRNILGEYWDLLGDKKRGALGGLILPLALFSIFSAILLFGVMLYTTGTEIAHTMEVRSTVPLAYAYVPQTLAFDWFYMPTTFFTLLGLIAIACAVSMIFIGRMISHTRGPVLRSTFAYLLLYSFVAPLWLLNAAFDVALGKKRAWK